MSTSDWQLRLLSHLTGFLAGFRFAALVVSLLVGFALLIVLVLVVPDDAGAFGAFARDFKVWCFSYDPASGDMPSALALMMLSELLLFALFVAFFWWEPIIRARREQPRSLVRWAGSGLFGSFGLSALLMVWSAPSDAPAEPMLAALRTSIPAPELALVDQSGASVRLADLRDKVVLVTAVYATCGLTCPMIMGQAKRAVAGLNPAERADLVVLGVTLDPAHDTTAVLTEMASAQGVTLPTWHLLTGAPDAVEATLDRWAFARRRNPETGQIEHANLFVLVDRNGRQAFRLSLTTDAQSGPDSGASTATGRNAWLEEALRLLLAEKRLAEGGS